MQARHIKVKLHDGGMGAYLAIPDRTPAGAIIAIMEIWSVNDTYRKADADRALASSVAFFRRCR